MSDHINYLLEQIPMKCHYLSGIKSWGHTSWIFFFFSPSQYLIYWAQLVNWNFSLEWSAFISRITNNSASGKSNLSSGFFADTCNIRWRRWISTQQIRFEREREREVGNRDRFKCTKTQKNLSSEHEIIFQQKQKIWGSFNK